MRVKVDLVAQVPNIGPVAITGGITDDMPPQSPYEAIQAWLGAIDAGELERVALDAMEMGAGTFTHEVLSVLKRWACGEP